MLVHSVFDDDHDDATMWLQHDCYRETMSFLCDGVRERWLYGAKMLRDESIETIRCRSGEGFDHRPIQRLHDIFAAYWRRNNGLLYPRLPFVAPDDAQIASDWTADFKREAATWFADPHFVGDFIRFYFTPSDTVAAKAIFRLSEDFWIRYGSFELYRPQIERLERNAYQEYQSGSTQPA